MKPDQADDAMPGLQGLGRPDWLSPDTALLARQTNDLVRDLAAKEMEPGLSASDFTKLLIEAARIAEAGSDA